MTVEIIGSPLDGLRPTVVSSDISVRESLKSVFTLRPCLCGQVIGYLSIGHVPLAFRPDDPVLEAMGTMGEIVDAPSNAELFEVLRKLPKCWGET